MSGSAAPADSQAASVASQVLQDCLYDIQEIRICRDCYRMSNEKPTKSWFCRPCRPPHQLVFAKQKGYPFWPAKVRDVGADSGGGGGGGRMEGRVSKTWSGCWGE